MAWAIAIGGLLLTAFVGFVLLQHVAAQLAKAVGA